jgi:thioredoxin reductase
MKKYEVTIIGGSIAGLSAALILGRALKNILIIDDLKPCFRFSDHTHGFITHDGNNPKDIVEQAKKELLNYPNITWYSSRVKSVTQEKNYFSVNTNSATSFRTVKLLLATGVKDKFPPIKGFNECWGKSILHCPYCQGYEIRNHHVGFIGNGDYAFERIKLLSGWTKWLTLFTNDPNTLNEVQIDFLSKKNIMVVEGTPISIIHTNGQMESLKMSNGDFHKIAAVFTKIDFQPPDLAIRLGCVLTEANFICVDDAGRTNIAGIFAAGDCASAFRTVPTASAAGVRAAIAINHELSKIK